MLSESVVFCRGFKGSHRSVAYLAFRCLECLMAVLLNDSAAFKVVCEN